MHERMEQQNLFHSILNMTFTKVSETRISLPFMEFVLLISKGCFQLEVRNVLEFGLMDRKQRNTLQSKK